MNTIFQSIGMTEHYHANAQILSALCSRREIYNTGLMVCISTVSADLLRHESPQKHLGSYDKNTMG